MKMKIESLKIYYASLVSNFYFIIHFNDIIFGIFQKLYHAEDIKTMPGGGRVVKSLEFHGGMYFQGLFEFFIFFQGI